MMKNYFKQWRGIWWIGEDRQKLRIQIHTPRWQFKDGDYFIKFVTIIRVIWGAAPSYELRHLKEYGLGIVILGFGFAITWYKERKDNEELKVRG